MSDLRDEARQALEALKESEQHYGSDSALRDAIQILRAALAQPERTLTDEVIADLWHQNGGFHHHFARAVERYLKGEE
jgi:hypothetical protein